MWVKFWWQSDNGRFPHTYNQNSCFPTTQLSTTAVLNTTPSNLRKQNGRFTTPTTKTLVSPLTTINNGRSYHDIFQPAQPTRPFRPHLQPKLPFPTHSYQQRPFPHHIYNHSDHYHYNMIFTQGKPDQLKAILHTWPPENSAQ